jgi:chromosome segregation ATPase
MTDFASKSKRDEQTILMLRNDLKARKEKIGELESRLSSERNNWEREKIRLNAEIRAAEESGKTERENLKRKLKDITGKISAWQAELRRAHQETAKARTELENEKKSFQKKLSTLAEQVKKIEMEKIRLQNELEENKLFVDAMRKRSKKMSLADVRLDELSISEVEKGVEKGKKEAISPPEEKERGEERVSGKATEFLPEVSEEEIRLKEIEKEISALEQETSPEEKEERDKKIQELEAERRLLRMIVAKKLRGH